MWEPKGEVPLALSTILSVIYILKHSHYFLLVLYKQKPPWDGWYPLQSWSHPQTPMYVCLFISTYGVSDDKKDDLEVISVASRKANEPVSWHVWCMSPLCHDSFTRMSVNSPTTSCEIGCGQSVLDETCVKVYLIWLIDWTKWCLYKEETH